MKVFAKLESASRSTDAAPATYRVEYTVLSGVKRSGHAMLAPTNYSSHSMMMFSLRGLLASHLSSEYAPQTFRDSDILGLG